MSTRSLRHRSSRYSSPATFGEKEPAKEPVEAPPVRNGQQTSLDGWIEPVVRTAVPSFEDTKGLERVGVLENMQPLGVPPSHRLLQKLKLTFVRPSPRATPAQTEEVITPAAETEKMDLASPMEPEILSDFPSDPPRPSDTIVISSPPRGRPSRREVAEMPQVSHVSPSGVKLVFAANSHASPKPASIQEHLRQDRINGLLDHALQEAQDKGTPNLVPGLEKLREDAQTIPELYNVLEAVIQQSPTGKQLRTFKRYIKSGIRDFRRGSFHYIPRSPLPSPHTDYNNLTSPEQPILPIGLAHPRITSTGFTDEGNRRIASYFGQPHNELTRDSLSLDAPLSPGTATFGMNLDPALTGSQTEAPTSTSPNKRKRSNSQSSTSTLSSAQSLADDFVPIIHSNDGQTGNSRSRSAGQRQTTQRAFNRLRSAAGGATPQPLPKQSEAQSTPKATTKKFKRIQLDPDFDPDEFAQRKRHYLDDSFHDYNTIPRPESNDRESVHAHPAPLTLSPRPPPPVIHPNRLVTSTAGLSSPVSTVPLDGPLTNGAGRKRIYDELEGDVLELTNSLSPSPIPLLVPPPPPGLTNAASRGATPRSTRLQPGQKTRKSARVLVS